MYQLKLGKSIGFPRHMVVDAVREAVENSFDAVDLDICTLRKDRELELEEEKHLGFALETVRRSGLILNGIHISFGALWNFANPNESLRRGAVENLRAILPTLEAYSPRCYVIHGSREPISNEERPVQLDALHRSLVELTALTSTPIALEALPRTCLFNTSAEGIAIVDAVPGVRVCVDVNHFLKEDPCDAILALGNRIITTHISDYDFIDERHLLPGEGKIDWMRLIAAFEAIGYNGIFNYEIGKATAKEIKENYDRLFAEYNRRK
ncbi:MAG: sugar phosphate isomerase/epimerase [Ruminococcaceae bacterium]|nr:sugar phosphate isomerase/epimerase [Oscillospiraceae bacterium]